MKAKGKKSFTRSLTRLVVGGLANAYDAMAERMGYWEAQAARDKKSPEAGVQTEIAAENIAVTSSAADITDNDSAVHYALIGLVFEAQDRLESSAQTLDRATSLAGRIAGWFVEPAYHSRLLKP